MKILKTFKKTEKKGKEITRVITYSFDDLTSEKLDEKVKKIKEKKLKKPKKQDGKKQGGKNGK